MGIFPGIQSQWLQAGARNGVSNGLACSNAVNNNVSRACPAVVYSDRCA